jgi:uncharacterized protein YlxW (UPF0749 family)
MPEKKNLPENSDADRAASELQSGEDVVPEAEHVDETESSSPADSAGPAEAGDAAEAGESAGPGDSAAPAGPADSAAEQDSPDETSADEISEDVTSPDEMSEDVTSPDEMSEDVTSPDEMSEDVTSSGESAPEAAASETDRADGESIVRSAPEASKPFVPARRSGLKRLWKALKAKPDLGQVWVAVLIGALGFTAVVQVRIDDDELLERARRADLIEIFSDLQNRSNRLESEIRDLQTVRSELLSGEASEQAAREQAVARQGQLGVLAGTLPAQGPGIVVSIPQIDSSSAAVALLSMVQELRVAGAEAIQVAGGNGETVRVGVNTYFIDADQPDTIEIDGKQLTLPVVITALGESRALAGSMSFGGSAPESATVEEYGELTIDVVREPLDSEYARPAEDD